MKILLDDQDGRIVVVENPELGYYELRLREETVGTLDYRDIEGRRVLGLTEIRPELRGRGLATKLIRAVLEDLRRQGARVGNYCPAVDRFLHTHEEYQVVIDAERPGMSDLETLHRAGTAESALDAALRSEHIRLHDLAVEPQDHRRPPHHRRHGADLFSAYAAQHLAAATEVLLRHARSWPPGDVSAYLDNTKELERSLRILKGRQYGDTRYLHLDHDEMWQIINQLLGEHDKLERHVSARISAEFDHRTVKVLAEDLLLTQDNSPTRAHPYSPHTGIAGRLAHRLWSIADSTADDLEGRLVPTRYRPHPKRNSAFSHYLLGTPIEDDDAVPD